MESILLPTEIDFYVDTMKVHEMENLGTLHWIEWHKRLQWLNQQAVIEASAMREEYVKEALVSFEKLNILIYEAITINLWKYKVLPQLLKLEPSPESTMIAYSILYHEAVCVNLLELVTFHASSCEALEDSALDLLDYSVGLSSRLLSIKYRDAIPTRETAKEELYRQRDNLNFEMGIKALGIIRYMCENMERLPLSISSVIYVDYDIPMLFIEILKTRPWIKEGKQYVSGKWLDWDGEVVSKTEAQVWLALREMLQGESCQQHYSLTESRKAQLVNLTTLLTPVILDQLSPLIHLKQLLSQIAFGEQSQVPPKPILLQHCLEIKERVMTKSGAKWKEIAENQLGSIFTNDRKQLVEYAKMLNEAYNTDVTEKFEIKEQVPCARCGKDSDYRCSKCKKLWYCSRKCQVEHWLQHKPDCKSE